MDDLGPADMCRDGCQPARPNQTSSPFAPGWPRWCLLFLQAASTPRRGHPNIALCRLTAGGMAKDGDELTGLMWCIIRSRHWWDFGPGSSLVEPYGKSILGYYDLSHFRMVHMETSTKFCRQGKEWGRLTSFRVIMQTFK